MAGILRKSPHGLGRHPVADKAQNRPLLALAFSFPPTTMPLLFSYGTLQQANVQQATFGHELAGTADALIGYEQARVAIDNPEVVRTSGKTHHPIVRHTGEEAHQVQGTVFEVTEQELAHADQYEVAAYKRVAAPLASGRMAWVYVDARYAPPDAC